MVAASPASLSTSLWRSELASRKDNAPKSFGEVLCTRCGGHFQATGPNNKRCEPCKRLHKREYESKKKRASKRRLLACLECGEAFPPDVHAHQKRCVDCARKAHRLQSNVVQLRLHHERYRHDAGRRLHLSVSVLVRRSLGQAKAGRSWEGLLGFDVGALRAHLERQFLPGMSWENYGSEWHVDHIVPRASFHFDNVDHPDFRACWALTNLRPLWARENRRKSGKRLHLI